MNFKQRRSKKNFKKKVFYQNLVATSGDYRKANETIICEHVDKFIQ